MSVVITKPLSVQTAERSALDGDLVRSLAWTGGMKWVSQILNWAATVIVARMLVPEDYGLVGMASVYLALVALVNEFGLSAAVVTRRHLTHNQIAQINSLSLLLGLAALIISVAAAFPASSYFNAPELGWVIVVMSSSFVTSALATVPYSLLQRDLQFKLLALIEGFQAFAQAAGMVAFAFLGLRYWTLVCGSLLSGVVFTGMLLWSRPHSFAWPRPASIKDALTFSWHVLVARLCWFAQSNGDRLIAGRILGKAALGAYAVGWTLASLPIEKITGLMSRVTPAFFSAVQTDFAAIRRYLLTLTEGLAFLTLPAGCGLALVAEELVAVALGENWGMAVRPLQILAILTGIRAIDPLLSQILYVVGESRFVMRLGLAAGPFLVLSFYFGSRWGIVGIAAAWLAFYPFLVLPLYWKVFKTISLSPSAYLSVLWPAFNGTLVMAAAVLLLKLTIPSSWPMWLLLGTEVATAAVVYFLTVFTFHGERVRRFYRFLRTVRG